MSLQLVSPQIIKGDSLEQILTWDVPIDLVVTDPPYAFSGSGAEHELTATVAVVLRETARRLSTGSWMVVFAASSWRSTSYMIDALRGVVEPVRIATWAKPETKTKVKTSGWGWASVNVIAFRKGKSRFVSCSPRPDYIVAAPLKRGRRAELPPAVADWAVEPYAIANGNFLDPFAGSGALVLAAERAGMNGYGFESRPPHTFEDSGQAHVARVADIKRGASGEPGWPDPNTNKRLDA